MADAKITLTTEAKNEGLEQLNNALAEGQQSVLKMKTELRELEKATKNGTQATKEQADAMVALRKSINEQSAANRTYQKEIASTTAQITSSVKAMAQGDAGARQLASSFQLTSGFTTAFSVALGELAATLATAALSAMKDLAAEVVTLGAQMQQSVAHIAAMKNNLGDATEAYRAFNDVGRNTTYSLDAVQQMGIQLMNMGYSAQNAAVLIQLCADTAAGLGQGQEGAQQLVTTLSRIQATGEMSSRQLIALQMAGMDLDKAFSAVGMSAEEAMKAMDDGTLDAQTAIQALTDYMHEFDGSMEESKNNTIDAWGDVEGNISTACEEIGAGIFDAFNQSGIIQELIDFTQDMITLLRGDGCGAFADIGAIAGEVLNFIAGLLGFVFDTIRVVILILNDAYAAFKSFGAEVVEAIRPAVDIILAMYEAVKTVLAAVGKAVSADIERTWGETFVVPSVAIEGTSENHFREIAHGGGGGGGGGGGSRSSRNSDEARAAREEERARREAERAAAAAAKAAQKAFEEEFKAIYSEFQEGSKTLLDAWMGDPESAASKIKALKEQLVAQFEEIDQAAATAEQTGDLNPLASILKKTPDALAEELAAKGQTLSEFVALYKEQLASAAEAEGKSVQEAENWNKQIVNYCKGVAGAMSDAMVDFIMGAKSGQEALKDFAKTIIKNALQLLTQWLSLFAVFSIVGDPALAARNASAALFGSNGGAVKLASGGYVRGPGTGTSDSIPAMLSNGEYVLNSAAVDRIGVGNLNAINAGAFPHFADGGSVDDTLAANAGVGNVTLSVSAVDAASFADFLDRGGLDRIKQALFEDNRRFASAAGVW